ncbi:Spermidine/putrescine transport system permease protein PotB [Dickeya dianthicola]|uniref:ABC transporter permease subunit n=1 Tax=Dickeya dianthicola TaxID=204039 RepID=A0AAP6RXQ0_9GAMM|nr:ABC transporter permease subunit [Dickeya dianthicola]AYC19090.1 Spermidine/putrescine transport system permease protein PotB [Dickeya dianthicola]MBI0438043.1 ABC transporter permease subunit [Dickeya dianthicola]MBI0448555.1 ABC transporter permease subunit [Dickeya dianthicola]MBI0452926.1 ABC transporter permease subunit [Dickeya dianthicola]MBI0457480.1 ABC transporter permease subunit [Dickeya dianthicola]
MRSSLMAYLMLLPGLGIIVLAMGAVLGMAFSQSLGFFNFAGESGLSLRFWQTMLSDEQLWRAFFYSARIALLSALLSAALAYPLAIWLRKPFPGAVTLRAVLKAPLLVPGLTAAFLFVNFISYQGFLNVAMLRLGLTERPIRMQNDASGIGVILLQIWKQMPFALLLLSGSVQAIGDTVLDAARNLGAGAWVRFRRIVLPLTLRALQTAMMLIFIGAAGDFSFQSVAGPVNINSMSQLMLRVQQSGAEGWNQAAVVAVMLMLLSLAGAGLLAVAARAAVNGLGR